MGKSLAKVFTQRECKKENLLRHSPLQTNQPSVVMLMKLSRRTAKAAFAINLAFPRKEGARAAGWVKVYYFEAIATFGIGHAKSLLSLSVGEPDLFQRHKDGGWAVHLAYPHNIQSADPPGAGSTLGTFHLRKTSRPKSGSHPSRAICCLKRGKFPLMASPLK